MSDNINFLTPLRVIFPKMPSFVYGNLTSLIGGNKVRDLLLFVPRSYQQYNFAESYQQLKAYEGQNCHLKLMVLATNPKIILQDINGQKIELHFYRASPWQKILKVEQWYYFLGAIEPKKFGQGLIMKHPSDIFPLYLLKNKQIQPIYPLTQGINQNMIRKKIQKIVQILDQGKLWPREWLLPQIVSQNNFLSWPDLFKEIHGMKDCGIPSFNLKKIPKLLHRLAYDEFLCYLVELNLLQKKHSEDVVIPGALIEQDLQEMQSILPSGWIMTKDQVLSLKEMITDQYTGLNQRFLQGEVGSGKTLVILLLAAYILTKQSGAQVAILVPTEILARQHYHNATLLLEKINLTIGLLVGSINPKNKKIIYGNLASGQTQLIIGTHALLEPVVEFTSLKGVIIDEQHKFGVQQRQALLKKGIDTYLLLVSATPIPRTMMQIYSGILKISTLYSRPKGDIDIKTQVRSHHKIEHIKDFLAENLDTLHCFWICPVIHIKLDEDGEEIEGKKTPCESRFLDLQSKFGNQVEMLHGGMTEEVKNDVLNRFRQNEFHILVSTTVIEVGIDIPQANVMIIEDANHFGLAQLHQIRGRIGRNGQKSLCILLTKARNPAVIQRMQLMQNCQNGFELAENDMRLRGSGEYIGLQQSGDNWRFFGIVGEKIQPDKAEINHIVQNTQLLDDIRGWIGKI